MAFPIITGMSPSSGPIAGGTSVTLTGKNFTGVTAVTFGGSAATAYTVVNDTTIIATAPAHAAGAQVVQARNASGPSPAGNGASWTNLLHKTGPDGVANNDSSLLSEIDDLVTDGHNILLTYDRTGDTGFSSKMNSQTSIKYISDKINQLVLAAASGDPDNNAGNLSSLITSVNTYLSGCNSDTHLAGHWMLDDYPGVTLVATLEAIKARIDFYNGTAPFNRFGLLGLKGTLDRKDTSVGQANWDTNYGAFDPGVVNFSPNGCHAVTFYPYGESWLNSPDSIDWGMTNGFLGHMVAQIRARGVARVPAWNPDTLVWGTMIQAFGPYSAFNPANTNNIEPRYADILANADAYVKGGAHHVMFYTWHDGGSEHQPINTTSLKNGVKDMATAARTFWAAPSYQFTYSGSGGGGTNPALSTLQDAFPGPALASVWSQKAGAGGAVAIVAGRLRLTPGTATGDDSYARALGPYSLVGSTLQAQIVSGPFAADADTVVRIVADASNDLCFKVWNSSLYVDGHVAGAYARYASAAYNATNHAFVRIREAGGTLIFETSADAASWSSFASFAAPFAVGAVAAHLSVAQYAGTLTPAEFDNVNVAPDLIPPTISAISVSGISPTGATINWTTDEVANGQVRYGLTSGYGSTSALVAALTTPHAVALSGLTPNTTYHYQIVTQDAAGNTATSTDRTFQTGVATDTTPPVLSGVTVSGITASAATISWATDELADTQVDYGPTSAYGNSTTLADTPVATAGRTAHSAGLSGLSAATTYHYRVRSRDASGNLATGTDATFTTAAAVAGGGPVPTALTPSTLPAGSAGFTLTVTGTGFTAGNVVRWNNQSRATTYVNATTLTAVILAGDVAAYGTAQVTVV